jgi:hypothetical protein
MDEAGNTGENLLDATQPVYALAAIRVDAQAHEAIAAALARTQMPELKFQRLRRTGAGRRIILELLNEVEPRPANAAVMVVHKPWMLAAKLVDELIEPRMLAKGLQMAWYKTGSARRMAHAVFGLAPDALGDVYAELQATFVALLRDYSETRAEAFLKALRRAKIVCVNEEMHDLLSVMIDTPTEVRAEFATRRHGLDPSLTALFCLAGHWSSFLAQPYEVVHDESVTVRRWAAQLDEMIVARETTGELPRPETLVAGEIVMPLPTMLKNITFATSEHDERVQLADVLAGCAAHLYAARTGAKPFDRFARDIERAGVGDLSFIAVGPEIDDVEATESESAACRDEGGPPD